MFENKLAGGNVHYSRIIASWTKVCTEERIPVFFGRTFKGWLEGIGCSEEEMRDIYNMATNGKLELEASVRHYLRKN